MPSSPNNDSHGIVQWVIPPKSSRTKKNSTTPQNRFRLDSQSNNQTIPSSHNDNNSNSSFNHNLAHRDSAVSNQSQTDDTHQQVLIDDAVCRTISIIVEEYLKELREHQKLINDARSRMIRNRAQDLEDGNLIAQSDVSRLKVRDEQTKAIETIRQLTNYLRELSYLNRQIGMASNLVSDDISNKLSDVRNDIIQALNDFAIANNDIDIPILDPDDSNYDFCTEVLRSSSDFRKVEVSQSSGFNEGISSDSPTNQRKQSLLIVIDEEKNNQTCQSSRLQVEAQDNNKFVELEKRRREVQKLEKDTVELRRLFADFYNLIKLQGEQVDSIEDNIVMAAQQISVGKQHLNKSVKSMTVLVSVTGCITGALIGGPIGFFIGGKLGGVTIICASSLLGLISTIGAQKCLTYSNRLKHD